MVIGDASGLPVAAHVASASPHEVTLVEETIKSSWLKETPERLIGDKAYDSDKLDDELYRDKKIIMIAPNRSNIKKCRKPQDGRGMRRYKRRWKIERINAWLQNFRRIVVRWEYKSSNYAGFVLLACLIIITRNIDF